MESFVWGGIGFSALAIFALALGQVLRKAGYSGWLAVFALIPGAGIFIVLFLGMSTWPIERQLALLRLETGKINPKYLEGAFAAAVAGYTKGDLNRARAVCERIATLGDDARGFLSSLDAAGKMQR